MEQYYQFKNLLTQVNAISKHYNKIEYLTGGGFNIFRILKLQTSEVRLHSSFLAELLNPKGTHGQKDIFLKIFVENYQFKGNNFDTASGTIEVEKYTGSINEKYTEGGRIDLIITDKDRKKIIIENKIYAGDEENQLVRYNNYCLEADLFYLTLDGKLPSAYSMGELKANVDFRCLSYSIQITEWLEQCKKEVASYPIIRETITQYLYLIKHLTNQTMNDGMRGELATLITSSYESTEAAFTIIHSLEAIKEKLLIKFNDDLQELAKELNVKITNDLDFKHQYNGVYFYREGWKNGSVAFGFQSYSNVLLYGILLDKPDQFQTELRASLVKIKPNDTKTSEWWPIFRNFEYPFNNWNNSKEVWTAVADGSMKQEFKHRVIEFLDILDRNDIML
jgi:hypothetical protein